MLRLVWRDAEAAARIPLEGNVFVGDLWSRVLVAGGSMRFGVEIS